MLQFIGNKAKLKFLWPVSTSWEPIMSPIGMKTNPSITFITEHRTNVVGSQSMFFIEQLNGCLLSIKVCRINLKREWERDEGKLFILGFYLFTYERKSMSGGRGGRRWRNRLPTEQEAGRGAWSQPPGITTWTQGIHLTDRTAQAPHEC